jgi:ATP-dependent helicase/nuclease subunit A
MTSGLSHQAISASAGSGKTFRLAHRYIRLLAEGVPPDRICALTFSRKAAGEIFDSIVDYLCKAASSADDAAATAAHVERDGLGTAQFGALLRTFLNNLHRMHIGTLDSFMIGVARAFPTELGIPSEFQVMDSEGSQASDIRESILARIFDPRSANDKTQRLFLEAFKQATFGQEEKGLGNRLNRFIDENLSHYYVAPAPALWGDPAAMGLTRYPWLLDECDPQEAADDLRTALTETNASEDVSGRFVTFAETAAAFHLGSPWPKAIEYLFSRLAEDLPALERGEATVKIGRSTFEMPPAVCHAALALLRHVIRCEVVTALKRTAGLQRVLALYEAQHDAQMRATGQMTFTDAQILLTPANTASGGAAISRDSDAADKLYIDYRLDCQLDHWLLDEFQDTSDLQWSALRNLADEILQDDSGNRSFFYVGDVKQAIYAWRGGNAQLFGKILDRYGELIERVPMNTSYRSCPAIIDTVNAIFGKVSADDGLQPQAADAWNTIWQTHQSADHLKETSGYATLVEPAKPSGDRFTDADRYDVVAAILNELQPVERGLDVAVLVMSNRAGYTLVDHLRRACPGMPVVHEGNATILDNPVVALLLSLLTYAAHPGDRFALQHLRMSPLRDLMQKDGTLAVEVLTHVHTHGFQAAVRHWGSLLEQRHELDQFGRIRLGDLIEAAATFDETGSRDVDAFVRYASAYKVREQAAAHAIRVMTVHQSKGLGFDVVVFPELQGRSMTTSGALSLTTSTDPASDEPNWVLDMPRRAIALSTPVLEEEVHRIDNDTCFNALCALYVALTRAKRALYLVTHKPGKTSTSENAAAFVKTRLTGKANPDPGTPCTLADQPCATLYEIGQRDWFATCGEEEKAETPQLPRQLPDDFIERPSTRTRLERVEPSTEKEVITSAAHLFSAESRDVLDFGSAIHELFEAVEWINDLDPEAVIAAWLERSSNTEEVKRDVCTQFRNALTLEPVKKALSRPQGHVELWRERSFEIVLESQWVSGQFDRVTILRDQDGHAVSASILDYKSNRIDQPAQFKETTEHYRPQLELYGRALAQILKLPETAIVKQLLFTRTGTVTEV